MIYEKSGVYYIKQGNLYFVADIIIKKHTVVVMPTSEYITNLDNATEISYQELKEMMKK